jgi:hypothetical protein
MPKAKTAPKKTASKAKPAKKAAAPKADTRPITERVQSVKDLWAVSGKKPYTHLPYKNIPVNKRPDGEDDGFNEQRWHNAAAIIRLLCKVLNKDYKTNKEWVPGLYDDKYRPYFLNDKAGFRFGDSCDDGTDSGAGAGSGLCFRNRALSDHAAKYFLEVFKDLQCL